MEGGIALPEDACVVPLLRPQGYGWRRTLFVVALLPYYILRIGNEVARADVVHTPLPGDIPLIGMLVAVLFRKRVIARYGGSWQNTSQTTTMNRITRALMKVLAGGHNVMLATGTSSDAPAPQMHWVFATSLTEKELESIQPNLRNGLHTPPELVYVGRLSPEKGVEVLLRAFRQALDVLPDEHRPNLTVVGDGPQRRYLEKLVSALQCEERVRFRGQLDRRELSVELEGKDLAVLPSLTEGFAKASLEALAHGLPIIATNVGSAAAIAGKPGERGWIVPPGDPDALARALVEVLTDCVDWGTLRRRCYAYARQFTLEAWAQEIRFLSEDQWGISLKGPRDTPCT